MIPLIVWFAAYLVGAVPFGYLVARARGVNIFEQGSGNIGATNVGRVLGKPLGLLVFVLDFGKGAAPVLAAACIHRRFFEAATSRAGDNSLWQHGLLEVGAGLAAFLGHLFPIYLGFRGGKGVATGAGVVAVLFPLPMLSAFLTFAGVVLTTRLVSLASMVSASALLLMHVLLVGTFDLRNPRTIFAVVAVGLVLFRHRGNWQRIRAGTENQIKEHPIMQPIARSLHVLALGLWLGATAFFSFGVALPLFREFEALGQKPAESRPIWLPMPEIFAFQDGHIDGPKEQGARVVGHAVSGIFPWYFFVQGACGLVALATALGWTGQGRLHRVRFAIVGAAVLLVVVGWPLERKVSELRPARNQTTDAYLTSHGAPATLAPMLEARAAFTSWHLGSLFANLATIVLVFAALTLAGQLPESTTKNGPRGE